MTLCKHMIIFFNSHQQNDKIIIIAIKRVESMKKKSTHLFFLAKSLCEHVPCQFISLNIFFDSFITSVIITPSLPVFILTGRKWPTSCRQLEA